MELFDVTVRGRWPALVCALFAVLDLSCTGAELEPRSSQEPDATYRIEMTVGTSAALPECNSSLAGQVAFVTAPPSLWSCIQRRWIPLPCTTLSGGLVAYASTSETLVACAGGHWTVVPLPAGPAGDPGTQGEPGEPGAPGSAGLESLIVVTGESSGVNCPSGGERIDVGIDTDRSGVLEPDEVQQTAYVCNGIGAPSTPDAGPASPTLDNFQPQMLAMSVTDRATFTFGLSQPVEMDTVVELFTSNPAIVTLEAETVTIPAGQSEGAFAVRAVSIGSASVGVFVGGHPFSALVEVFP
jgi:hypothetical protein